MTDCLPPHLLALFAPRDPIPFMPPIRKKLTSEKQPGSGYTGVSEFLDHFENPSETPAPIRPETKDEKKYRLERLKIEQAQYKLEREIAQWDPHNVLNGTENPLKTLFVGRINYETTEKKLRREFEYYGPIKKIAIIHDTQTGKPRGYAFIEYESERDMTDAFRYADGMKIDGRRVVVDVERGRTILGWFPRRLGGGLGGTRRGGPEKNCTTSGREGSNSHNFEHVRKRSRSPRRRRNRRKSRSHSHERKSRSPERRRSWSGERKRMRSRSHSPRRDKRHYRSRSRDKDRRDRRSKRSRRCRSRDGMKRRRSNRDDGENNSDFQEPLNIKIKEEIIENEYI